MTQDKILGLVSILLPIIFAFLIGALLTGKLFNLDVPFSLVDYVIIGVGLITIYLGVREQLKIMNDLNYI